MIAKAEKLPKNMATQKQESCQYQKVIIPNTRNWIYIMAREKFRHRYLL